MFVVIEGPNGVGKTAVVEALIGTLETALPCEVHRTAEPSSSRLGEAIREMEATMPPEALALSCAADRFDHVAREIAPRLEAGGWVVCDRYVPSSLVLQRLDGLDPEQIWQLNKAVLQPDLTVYLEDDPATISRRLDERGRHSRFETKGAPEVELEYYTEAREFLAQQGWKQTVVDCRSLTPTEVADEIAARLRR
jgi:dTMP kinase